MPTKHLHNPFILIHTYDHRVTGDFQTQSKRLDSSTESTHQEPDSSKPFFPQTQAFTAFTMTRAVIQGRVTYEYEVVVESSRHRDSSHRDSSRALPPCDHEWVPVADVRDRSSYRPSGGGFIEGEATAPSTHYSSHTKHHTQATPSRHESHASHRSHHPSSTSTANPSRRGLLALPECEEEEYSSSRTIRPAETMRTTRGPPPTAYNPSASRRPASMMPSRDQPSARHTEHGAKSHRPSSSDTRGLTITPADSRPSPSHRSSTHHTSSTTHRSSRR